MKCSSCGYETAIASPACPRCRAWGTISAWVRAGQVRSSPAPRVVTGIRPLDHLVGGGLVPGSVYRVIAPGGTGKSTLCLDLATRIEPSAYLTSEEAVERIAERMARLRRHRPDLILGHIESIEQIDTLPGDVRLLVVDSLNVLRSPGVGGREGTNEQLVHAVLHVQAWAKARAAIALITSHMNQDGDAAGTTMVRHAVDCEIFMEPQGEGEPGIIHIPQKNRHGPAPRHCFFEHRETGLDYASDNKGDSEGWGVDGEGDEGASDDPTRHESAAGAPSLSGHRVEGRGRGRAGEDGEDAQTTSPARQQRPLHLVDQGDDAA